MTSHGERAPLLVVTGTGTGIGKTLTAVGLVTAWASSGRFVAGVKPVESGRLPTGELGGDGLALARASTFDLTSSPPPYLLETPVSPHLAARLERRRVEPRTLLDWLAPIRTQAQGVVLELPGGLFSPLRDDLTNADLLPMLEPTAVVLVAPDRLGVLHDVVATTRAAAAAGIHLAGVILSAPPEPDSSTGTNAEELAVVLPSVPVRASLPRAALPELVPYLASALDALGLR